MWHPRVRVIGTHCLTVSQLTICGSHFSCVICFAKQTSVSPAKVSFMRQIAPNLQITSPCKRYDVSPDDNSTILMFVFHNNRHQLLFFHTMLTQEHIMCSAFRVNHCSRYRFPHSEHKCQPHQLGLSTFELAVTHQACD